MDAIDITISAIVGLVVISQIVVTIQLLRLPTLTGEQKAWQIVIVWLLPVLGAGLILQANRALEREAPSRDRHHLPDIRDDMTTVNEYRSPD